MKKTLSIVLVAMMALIICSSAVFAVTSFSVAVSAKNTKVEVGEEVEVTVSLKNFTAGETGINSIVFAVDYDTAVFEVLEQADWSAANGWDTPTFNPTNGEAVTLNSQFMAEDHDMAKIKFKVKDTAKLGNTVITIKEVQASDASNEIYPSDQKLTLTIEEKAKQDTTDKNTVVKPDKADKNPSTGIEDFTIPAILVVSVLGIITYVRYRNLEK